MASIGSSAFSDDKMPLRLYGKLSNVARQFSSYDGYDTTFKAYGDYNLVTAYRYQAQASRVVQTDTQKTIQNLMENSVLYLLGLGILLIIIGNIKKRKE